jgi:hypothetical protein
MLGKRITITIILALQALSWSTSVAGAGIILPELNLVEWPITIRASLLLGTIIQGLLLFLFFFWKTRNSIVFLQEEFTYSSNGC